MTVAQTNWQVQYDAFVQEGQQPLQAPKTDGWERFWGSPPMPDDCQLVLMEAAQVGSQTHPGVHRRALWAHFGAVSPALVGGHRPTPRPGTERHLLRTPLRSHRRNNFCCKDESTVMQATGLRKSRLQIGPQGRCLLQVAGWMAPPAGTS